MGKGWRHLGAVILFPVIRTMLLFEFFDDKVGHLFAAEQHSSEDRSHTRSSAYGTGRHAADIQSGVDFFGSVDHFRFAHLYVQ